MKIPIIDFDGLNKRRPSSDALQKIDAACRNHGFFLIKNHGLSSLVDELWVQTRAFFDRPLEDKRRSSRSQENPMGYFDRELTKQKRDQKEVFDFVSAKRSAGDSNESNQWPDDSPEFKEIMERYFEAAADVSCVLTNAILMAAGEDADAGRALFGSRHTSYVRLNHYPATDIIPDHEQSVSVPLGDMALHEHTDAGAITLLMQDDIGGLQAMSNSGWIDVFPVEDAMIINVADMIQVLTNGEYKAALHRVRRVTTDHSRFSVPFFYNPYPDALIHPLPFTARSGARYESFFWRDFREARAAGDFADYGVETQISDYEIDLCED